MRLTKWAARLYPQWWRERYGDEFAALLEDARPGFLGVLDVARGAMAMRLSTSSARGLVWKGAALGLVVGAVFAMVPFLKSQKVAIVLVPSFEFRYKAEVPSILVGDLKMRDKILAFKNLPVDGSILAFPDSKDRFRVELRNVRTHESFGATNLVANRVGMNLYEAVVIPKPTILSMLPLAEGIGGGAVLGGLMGLIVRRRRQCA
jgi:hypothetical protein